MKRTVLVVSTVWALSIYTLTTAATTRAISLSAHTPLSAGGPANVTTTLASSSSPAVVTTSTTSSGSQLDGTAASEAMQCVSPVLLTKRETRWLVANLIMVGLNIRDGIRARELVRAEGIAGILVRGTPRIADTALLKSIRDARPELPTMVAVDEEGGRVQHLRKAIGLLPSAKAMAETQTPEQVRALAKRHARLMKTMGFTTVFGPVLDLQFGPNRGQANGIGDRGFSSDPEIVTAYASAFAQGMLDSGIYPVVKHFPGGGRADGDPHNKGTTSPSLADLRATDLIPFTNLLRTLPIGVMTGHQQVPGLDSFPSSLSSAAVTGLLRKELNFRGLAVTDSLSMWSISYYFNPSQAAILALRAGNDLLLFDDEPNVESIIGGLTNAVDNEPALRPRVVNAATNVFRAKGLPLCPGASAQLPNSSTSTTTLG